MRAEILAFLIFCGGLLSASHLLALLEHEAEGKALRVCQADASQLHPFVRGDDSVANLADLSFSPLLLSFQCYLCLPSHFPRASNLADQAQPILALSWPRLT